MATIVYPFPQVTASGSLPAVSPSALALTPRGLVSDLHISPVAGNAATIHVYDVATGIVLKDLITPASGNTDSFVIKSGEDQDGIDPTRFGVTVSGSDKANVYALIR